MNLPLPRHHGRQQSMKHLIDLLRREPLRRSGPAQFVVDLVEDCAELSRECDDPLAVDAVDQCKPFYRNATGLGLDGEVDGLDGLQTGVSGGGHRADLLPPRPETKLSQIKEAQFLNSPSEVVGVLEATGMEAPRPSPSGWPVEALDQDREPAASGDGPGDGGVWVAARETLLSALFST
jgi:hypothetical protein